MDEHEQFVLLAGKHRRDLDWNGLIRPGEQSENLLDVL
jgi:hypothetical protein